MKSRVILAVLVSVGAIVLIGLGIVKGSLFKVSTIEIMCDDINDTEKEYLASVAGIVKGDNIFEIDEEKIAAAMQETGQYYLDHITIVYPYTVKVHAVKRDAAAVIQYGTSYIVVDKDFNMIRLQRSVEPELVQFYGMRLSEYQIGSPVITKDEYQCNVAKAIVNELIESNTTDFISAVSLEDLSEIYLISFNGKRIDLCEAVDVKLKLKHLTEKQLQDAIFSESEYEITLYKDMIVIKNIGEEAPDAGETDGNDPSDADESNGDEAA